MCLFVSWYCRCHLSASSWICHIKEHIVSKVKGNATKQYRSVNSRNFGTRMFVNAAANGEENCDISGVLRLTNTPFAVNDSIITIDTNYAERTRRILLGSVITGDANQRQLLLFLSQTSALVHKSNLVASCSPNWCDRVWHGGVGGWVLYFTLPITRSVTIWNNRNF